MSTLKQHAIVLRQLREMILRGELASGERVTEAALAARLGSSRMPIRQSLPMLAKEGLLIPSGARGFAVRSFTRQDSVAAIRLRAALEGFAAREIVDRGASAALLRRFEACLAAGDAVFAKRCLVQDDEALYAEMNSTFHALLMEGAANPLLSELVGRCNVVPFVSPGALAFNRNDLQSAYDFLSYAQRQHHAIVEAVRSRDGGRAEFLLREHALTQEASLAFARPDRD